MKRLIALLLCLTLFLVRLLVAAAGRSGEGAYHLCFVLPGVRARSSDRFGHSRYAASSAGAAAGWLSAELHAVGLGSVHRVQRGCADPGRQRP